MSVCAEKTGIARDKRNRDKVKVYITLPDVLKT
jgi:hypothetical protein